MKRTRENLSRTDSSGNLHATYQGYLPTWA